MKIYPSDLMTVGKNYEGLERIGAFAAFHVRLQFPALITGALDSGLLLLTLLATLKMFGTKALDLAGLVVKAQLHSQGARTHVALSRNYCTVVTAASLVYGTKVTKLLI